MSVSRRVRVPLFFRVQQIPRRASLVVRHDASLQSQLLLVRHRLLLSLHALPLASQLARLPEQVERAPAPKGEGFESRAAGQREGERWRGGAAQSAQWAAAVHVVQCGGHSGSAQQKKDTASIAIPAAPTSPLSHDDSSDDDGCADAGGAGGRGRGRDERGERTDGHKMVGKPESTCGSSQLVPRCSSLLSHN